jgi:hypothetical protein
VTDRSPLLIAACAALTLTAGCGKSPDATPGTATLAASQSSAPATSPASGGAPATAATPAQAISGTVGETMDAANYTYVRLDTGKEQVWIAASQFPVKVGETLSVVPEMPMENFHSKSLNRDFPLIYFVSNVGRNGQAPVPAGAATPAMMTSRGPMGGGGAAPQKVVVAKLDPPAGGLSIADVWAKRDSLAGKTVVVRGTVVKYNAEIMGVNWLHIQDGSGVDADKTNDLTVTTSTAVKLGDVVTVTGTLATKKDFGAGYAYDAIIEKATVKLQ